MDNNSFSSNQTPEPSNIDPGSTNQTQKKPIAVWAVSIIAILVVVALGTYGVLKLLGGPGDPDLIEDQQEYESLASAKLDFLKLEPTSENIVYSPLSIRNGLALINSGANGQTKEEIEKVLTDAQIPQYKNISNTLSLANAIFIRDSFKDDVLSTYTDEIRHTYNGEIFYDNFESTDNMDNWIKKKTFNLIDSIGVTLEENSEMVLANSLAIQINWRYPFDFENTNSSPFHQTDGSAIDVMTMHQTTSASDIKYHIDDSTTALSMPLETTVEDNNLEFIAIMPASNLEQFIKTTDVTKLSNIVNSLTTANTAENGIEINIPRFKFDYKLNFKEDLESLGIKAAFSQEEADFSNMASAPLYVSQASHKANIDCSEEGIRAAAATTFVMDVKGQMEEPSQALAVTIDHPFLFLIRDADNGTVWFTGIVNQPSLWADTTDSSSSVRSAY